ncbi:hypothetical protein ILYODFUR_034219 [Ilyodon furcidens]|uniref:Uncharacterized protein n=1 Tax=Ilyodon furcidens TaxID=33524 RepID=A0ABV0UXI6_9TELE
MFLCTLDSQFKSPRHPLYFSADFMETSTPSVGVSLSSLLQGVTGRCCSTAAGHQALIRRDIKSCSVLKADVIVFAHQLDIASRPDSSANTDVLALPSLDSWDVPRCTDLLLLWLPSCCLVLDHSWMFSRSPPDTRHQPVPNLKPSPYNDYTLLLR